eukprot:scaffold142148_cov139-Phaeocystis_antarctica.AAC.1
MTESAAPPGDCSHIPDALVSKVVSEVATTRHTSLTFRSIATVGPSDAGLSGAQMAERSFGAIAYS